MRSVRNYLLSRLAIAASVLGGETLPSLTGLGH